MTILSCSLVHAILLYQQRMAVEITVSLTASAGWRSS